MQPKVLAAIALLFLAGCSSQPYVAPAGTETALLRVVDPRTGVMPASTRISTFEKAETCEGSQYLYDPQFPSHNSQMIEGFARIEAGKPFSLMVFRWSIVGPNASSNCIIIVTFVPAPGRHYLVESSWIRSDQCHMQVKSADSASMSNAQVEKVRRRARDYPLDASSRHCKPG